MKPAGKLYLVSVGPGTADLIPPAAKTALEQSRVVVSYDLYLERIRPWLAGKEIVTLPLTQEKERAQRAIDFARNGETVSLVSSGDIGVYAMAALAFEMLAEDDAFDVEVVPGITAANSCASLLGSPLSHDFATLSLSNLLCPWDWIVRRAGHLAEADMVVALYNVQSKTRQEGVYEILNLFLKHKSPGTWCGIVRNAYREGQEVSVCTLEELAQRRFDMFTTLIVGNRFTRRKGRHLYTPRGYLGWEKEKTEPAPENLPPAVWVFTGTGDGNALALDLAGKGHEIVASVASDYGREAALATAPHLRVRSGRIGIEARREELRHSALAIVDATHPFATEISKQLITLAKELSLPYLRYERPAGTRHENAIYCADMEEAAQKASALGTRIFLGTGTKDLERFLTAEGASRKEWFLRLLPDEASLERAVKLGIPRHRLCVMQGPFSAAFNEALWRDWSIDCVVTKESGEAGGLSAKAEAAAHLGIPLLIVERPRLAYPRVVSDFASVDAFLKSL